MVNNSLRVWIQSEASPHKLLLGDPGERSICTDTTGGPGSENGLRELNINASRVFQNGSYTPRMVLSRN